MTESKFFLLFKGQLANDREKFVQDWIVNWHYQDGQEGTYPEGQPQNFFEYSGPEDLITWFRWIRSPMPNYLPEEMMAPLMAESIERDREIFNLHNIPQNDGHFDSYAILNAQDYLFTHLYPTPDRQSIKNVLDFGAGYGRHSNLFSRYVESLTYLAVDAIPLSYCLQNFSLQQMELPFYEYVGSADEFEISDDAPGLYHLPTWRTDLLPENYFDVILCTQVLPELSPQLVSFIIMQFVKTLKSGGMLYIRDHEDRFNPSNINIAFLLAKAGFTLEFRPWVTDGDDIHGIPRIWRLT
jgi:SAM-dependent methyltransferase